MKAVVDAEADFIAVVAEVVARPVVTMEKATPAGMMKSTPTTAWTTAKEAARPAASAEASAATGLATCDAVAPGAVNPVVTTTSRAAGNRSKRNTWTTAGGHAAEAAEASVVALRSVALAEEAEDAVVSLATAGDSAEAVAASEEPLVVDAPVAVSVEVAEAVDAAVAALTSSRTARAGLKFSGKKIHQKYQRKLWHPLLPARALFKK